MLLCFDLDDTLLDQRSAERAATIHFAETFGNRLPVIGEAFVTLWREASERHFRAFLCSECSFQEQRRRRICELVSARLSDAEADRHFSVYLDAYKANWKLFDDVLPCLDALRSVQLGIITNASQAQQERKLERLGISRYFAFVLSAEKAGCAKPSPAIFQQAARAAKPQRSGEPQTCVYIGDSFTLDAEAATSAGWHGIWLDRRGSAREPSPTTLRTLKDLPAYLLDLTVAQKGPNEA